MVKNYILTNDNQVFDTSKYAVKENNDSIDLTVANTHYHVLKSDIVCEENDIRDLVRR